MATLELDAGAHKEITNTVASWAAYVERDAVTLVGVFATKSTPTNGHATLQFRMTRDVAEKLVRELAPWFVTIRPEDGRWSGHSPTVIRRA
jgi:hypothetical protein